MLNEGYSSANRLASLSGDVLRSAPVVHPFPARASVRDARTRHSASTIALHWATVGAIVVAVAVMFIRDATEDRALRQFLLETHRQLGLFVLFAAGLRIAMRLSRGLADHAPGLAATLRWAAKGAHVLLYAMLLALPLAGWAVTSAHGINLTFFGMLRLPQLVSPDSDLADTLTDYHVWLAWGLLVLVGMHVVAAIWHHFIRRDGVLKAMLPRLAGRPAQRPVSQLK